jgi:ATP-dependent Clp protease adaptor protein ClpS
MPGNNQHFQKCFEFLPGRDRTLSCPYPKTLPESVIPLTHQIAVLNGDTDTETVTTTDIDLEFVVLDEEELGRPYRVIIHNDNVTTFDFVIAVLMTIFELGFRRAERVALEAHTKGAAYVVTLPLEEAKNKVFKAQYAARRQGFPLTFSIEPE